MHNDDATTNGEPIPDPDAEGRAAWEAWDYPKLGETGCSCFLAGFSQGREAARVS